MKRILNIINGSFGVIQSIIILLFIVGLIRSLLWELETYEENSYHYKISLILYLIPLGLLVIFLISSLLGVIKKKPLLIYIPTLLIIILRIVKFWYPLDPTYNENSKISEIDDAPCVIILPETKTVLIGQTYKAQIILACHKPDSAQRISIDTDLPGEGSFYQGKIFYEYRPAKLGVTIFNGTVVIKKGEEEIRYSFEDKFVCIPPSSVISIDTLNYLFKGKENRISISHQAFLSKDLIVIAKNATIKKARYFDSISPGSFLVTPTGDSLVKIEVGVKVKEDTILLGIFTYKVVNKLIIN